MMIKGEIPKVWELDIQGTRVLCDGSSIMQGEDAGCYFGIFLAWDKSTFNTYLELLEEEYGCLRPDEVGGLPLR